MPTWLNDVAGAEVVKRASLQREVGGSSRYSLSWSLNYLKQTDRQQLFPRGSKRGPHTITRKLSWDVLLTVLSRDYSTP